MAKICMFRLEYTNVIFDSRVLREAEALSKNNEVYIIDILGNNSCKKELRGNIRIERIDLISKCLPSSIPFRLIKYLEFVIKASLKAFLKRCDVYHAHDLPTVLPAVIAGKMSNAKIIYDSHELYTEMGNLQNPLKKIAQIFEGIIIGKVDKVIVANLSRARIIEKMYKSIRSLGVIMNCPPFLEAGCDSFGKSWKKLNKSLKMEETRNKKIVLYQGGLSPGRGLENLLLASKYFRNGIVLVLLGEGQIKKNLIEKARELNLQEKVIFHNYVPYDELLSYTASADVGVIIYRNTCLNNYYCAPNKLFEYAAVGLPVAACNFPELEVIVKGYNIGKLFNPDNATSIAKAINSIFDSPKEYQKMKKNTISVKNSFNWAIEEKKLLKIYDGLLGVYHRSHNDKKS